MIPHPDPTTDAALTWAGALAYRLHELDRAQIAADYQSEAGKAHRGHLQKASPEILQQLVSAVKERLAEVP